MPASLLVVDDDPDIRDAVGEILEAEGFRVFRAANGQECLDTLAKLLPSPCIILLDLMMPVMDGLQALGKIPRSLRSRVVIVSADRNAVTSSRPFGVRAVLAKPFELTELLTHVHACCSGQPC